MKKPKQNQDKPTKANPSEKEYDSEANPPRFSFRYVVNTSPFDYDSLEKEHKVDLVNKLYRISQLTWAQIRLLDRHKLGYEEIKRDSLKFTVPSSVPEDANILAFRFSGLAPMIGYRSAFGTFYIIAFDTKFKAYEH